MTLVQKTSKSQSFMSSLNVILSGSSRHTLTRNSREDLTKALHTWPNICWKSTIQCIEFVPWELSTSCQTLKRRTVINYDWMGELFIMGLNPMACITAKIFQNSKRLHVVSCIFPKSNLRLLNNNNISANIILLIVPGLHHL